MFKSATRIATAAPLRRAVPRAQAARRFISTAPPHQKSRSWKSSAARWGLAGALVYYYNTATAFAEEPNYATNAPPETSRETETYQTIASISEERKAQARLHAEQSSKSTQSATVSTVADGEAVAPGSPEALEEEASEQGAFNEETGEINWDCPCLGGMAYGPCGEQFRAAFSCFVFSQEDPKGVDCIEHFKTMQNCFREHPDVYGSELEDDEDGAAEAAVDGEVAPVPSEPAPQATSVTTETSSAPPQTQTPSAPAQVPSQPAESSARSRATSAKDDESDASSLEGDESSDVLVPKAWHDSRDSTQTK